MCHLILVLPLLALPVFWLLPFGAAMPLYAVTLALTAGVYVLAVKAMRKPVCTGTETLLHAVGTVRAIEGRLIRVWVGSELWSAKAGAEGVAVGDVVEVIGFEGLTLRVRKRARASASSQPIGATGCQSHSKGER
jgi:membrane protein implicated in regulation of membrane protease activity